MYCNIIAEIGINHNGSIDIAKQLIDLAALTGCDYVKFQKRNPVEAVPDHQKDKVKTTPWGEMTYLEYKERIEFNELQIQELITFCNDKKIKPLFSVWDNTSAELIKNYCNIVKIPSAHLTNNVLIQHVAKIYEEVMISTGMSTEGEISDALKLFKPKVIFHTNSEYPSKIKDLNLNYIKHLKNAYPNVDIGYSGHEYGLVTTLAAVALGATWVERHITLDRTMWGSDQLASVEPIGLFKLVKGIRDIELSMGFFGERRLSEGELIKRKSLSHK